MVPRKYNPLIFSSILLIIHSSCSSKEIHRQFETLYIIHFILYSNCWFNSRDEKLLLYVYHVHNFETKHDI